MRINTDLHPWDISWDEAYQLQKEFASRLDLTSPKRYWSPQTTRLVAGVDISNNLYSNDIFAGVVVIDRDTLDVVEVQHAAFHTTFPYRSGFLSFREIPALLTALKKVKSPIDAIMVDGQGIAHPRRMGIASHLGLWVDVPTIGCAKSKLYGSFTEPDLEPFARSPITSRDGELLGYALRSKKRAKPLIISPGNHITPQDAVTLTEMFCGRYRLPEPTRQAHIAANQVRRAAGSTNTEVAARIAGNIAAQSQTEVAPKM